MTKKSFILYCDIQATVQKLPDDKAGQLFKMILGHVNGEEPEAEDLLLQIAFEPIRQQLNRDLESWDEKVGKRSKAGQRSAEVRKAKGTHVEGVEQKRTGVESVEQKRTGVEGVEQKGTHVESVEQKGTHVESVEQKSTNSTDTGTVNGTGTVTEVQNTKVEAAPLLEVSNFEKPSGGKSLHADCMAIYAAFFEKFSGGAPPKIDGAQGKAMKGIIAYLKGAVRKKQPGIRGDDCDEAVKDALRLIFGQWDRLDKFYMQKTRLTELNANLQNIIIQIRHSAGADASGPKGAGNRPSKMEIITRMADEAKRSAAGP